MAKIDKKIEKQVSNNYKKFLIQLIKNDDYTTATYFEDDNSFKIKYNINSNKDIVTVNVNLKDRDIVIDSRNTQRYRYYICRPILSIFNNIDWNLYKQLKIVAVSAINNDIQKILDETNMLIPLKYQRLNKINNLMKNE